MPFLAFFKLISPREWLLIGALVLAGIVLYRVYDAGENHVKAAEQKLVHAQEEANAKAELTVHDRIAAALAAYKAGLAAPAAPPAAVPHLVCHDSGGGAVPDRRAAAGGGNGAGATVPAGTGGADAGFDPAQAVSDTGTRADAEIKRLKGKVGLLQQIIAAYQAGGMVAT